MKTKLIMKCPNCGFWNRIEVNKLFIEQKTSEPKVQAFIPSYEPLKTGKTDAVGKIQLKKEGRMYKKHLRFASVSNYGQGLGPPLGSQSNVTNA